MRRGAIATVAAGAVLVAAAWAASPRTHRETDADLLRGQLDGVAVSTSGRLYHAPLLSRMSGPETTPHASHVWSMITDATGSVYLGTGPDGRVLKLSPSGRETVLFQADEPMITALAFLPGGDLLAGTAPEGKIYRIAPTGEGALWSETGARYVWSLVVAPNGSIFAGTGERGRIFRIDNRGEAHELFQAGEPHVVSLRVEPEGSLLAGSAGSGTVYRVDRDGHALVLYAGELAEVTGLANLPDGSVVATLLAPPQPVARRPAVRIRVPDDVDVGAAPDPARTLQDRESPTLEGVIEGLDGKRGDDDDGEIRGRLVRIATDGVVRTLWSSRTEAPYALCVDVRGNVLFGTGEPARLYSLDPGGTVARLAGLDEAQITALASWGAGFVLATSNPAAAYRVERDHSEAGVYLSPVFDAGGPARWGSIAWLAATAPGVIEVYTRTGNSTVPDSTWSAWGPAQSAGDRGVIDNPDGRYLQWRLKLRAGSDAVSGVSFTYEPYNRAPSIRDAAVEHDVSAASERFELRWSLADPDDDPLVVAGSYRGVGAKQWSPAFRVDGAPGATGTADWDVAEITQGRYEFSIAVSDAPGNPPGEALDDRATLILTVDRAPPTLDVSILPGDVVEIEAADETSAVVRVEAGIGDRTLHRLRSVDGVCDSKRERFRVVLEGASAPGGSPWWIRATDAAGNASEDGP